MLSDDQIINYYTNQYIKEANYKTKNQITKYKTKSFEEKLNKYIKIFNKTYCIFYTSKRKDLNISNAYEKICNKLLINNLLNNKKFSFANMYNLYVKLYIYKDKSEIKSEIKSETEDENLSKLIEIKMAELHMYSLEILKNKFKEIYYDDKNKQFIKYYYTKIPGFIKPKINNTMADIDYFFNIFYKYYFIKKEIIRIIAQNHINDFIINYFILKYKNIIFSKIQQLKYDLLYKRELITLDHIIIDDYHDKYEYKLSNNIYNNTQFILKSIL